MDLQLEEAIVDLPAKGVSASDRLAEAQAVATTTLSTLSELQKRYRMIRPALLHNLLINARFKKEGFCWHWTRDLKERLAKLPLKEYDLLWAKAREGSFREHNALVIVSRGMPLKEGLVLDGWRRSGRPFWIPVKNDRYPWKEENEVH